MKKIQKLTAFFRRASKEVHEASVAADSTKHQLTLLQQMAESRANNLARDKAKREQAKRLERLRNARLAEEDDDDVRNIEKEVRDCINSATGNNMTNFMICTIRVFKF
jgi:hypothetical protein